MTSELPAHRTDEHLLTSNASFSGSPLTPECGASGLPERERDVEARIEDRRRASCPRGQDRRGAAQETRGQGRGAGLCQPALLSPPHATGSHTVRRDGPGGAELGQDALQGGLFSVNCSEAECTRLGEQAAGGGGEFWRQAGPQGPTEARPQGPGTGPRSERGPLFADVTTVKILG